MFRFENYSRPPLRKNQEEKKSNIQMMIWKQLKQGRMQTLDKNFEMLRKAYV